MRHLLFSKLAAFCVLFSLQTAFSQESSVPVPNSSESLPSDVMEPQVTSETAPSEENPTSRPAEPVQEQAQEPIPTPAPAQTQEEPRVSSPSDLTDEEILESPTRNYELYEETRKRSLTKTVFPKWGINLSYTPRAFRKADLRVGGAAFNEPAVGLIGMSLSLDRNLFRSLGALSIGAEGGVYGDLPSTKYSYDKLFPAFQFVGAYAVYQLMFFERQWVVPLGRAGYEYIRYDYTYNKKDVLGYRGLVRLDGGLSLFLNVLEPSSAGTMQYNFGIKKTYAVAYYTMTFDTSQADFSLNENTFRFALRFEY